jgi:elongation factor P
MISTLNDIKKGLNVIHNSEPYLVADAKFVRMQAQKPVMQTKLKNLLTGKVIEITYHPSDKVKEANLQRKKVDYLYNDGQKYFFMSTDDFEQFDLPNDIVGDQSKFMKEGDKVDALFFNGNAVSISLPAKVELKVTSAPEGVKGNTAQGKVTKPVELETGVTIQAPLFIKDDDVIRVNTEDGTYSERV